MSYKKELYFLIYNLFYEIFMKLNFLYKKNIYVCVIDYMKPPFIIIIFLHKIRNRCSCIANNLKKNRTKTDKK